MRERTDLKAISDDRLLRGLFEILKKTRHDEADLIAHIAEVEERRLYAREAVASMFAWCTDVLRLSDYEAYLRIAVARASREHPVLLTMLRDGRLHLSGIALLGRHLTPENRDDILKRAAGKSHRQLKELAAELEPKPDTPATIRKLPVRRSEKASADTGALGTYQVASPAEIVEAARTASPEGGSRPLNAATPPRAMPASPGRRATVEPLSPARHKVQFTADAELRDKLERLQALMRSSVPDGDLAKIIDLAVTEKLERLEARRFGKAKKPRKRLAQTDTRPKSRYIPAAVRRFVEKRDGGRCTYRDTHGRRCPKRHDLEFHHRKAFGLGGDHSPEGLALMCHMHNALLAERDFGKEKMARYRRRASRDSKAVGVVGARTGPAALRAEWRSTGWEGRKGTEGRSRE